MWVMLFSSILLIDRATQQVYVWKACVRLDTVVEYILPPLAAAYVLFNCADLARACIWVPHYWTSIYVCMVVLSRRVSKP